MRPIPGKQIRVPRAAVVICAIIMAAAAAVAAAWPTSQHPATLPHASCGSATTHFLTGHTQLFRADHGALTCFVTAARTCKFASLQVTEMGVDTGTDYVYAIKPSQASCEVTELSQGYSANFGGSRYAVRTVPCHRTVVTRTGVALRCGGRDVLIPAMVSPPSPLSS